MGTYVPIRTVPTQQGVEARDELRIVGLGAGAEARDDAAGAVEQVLVEVPFRLARDRGEAAVERVGVVARDRRAG